MPIVVGDASDVVTVPAAPLAALVAAADRLAGTSAGTAYLRDALAAYHSATS